MALSLIKVMPFKAGSSFFSIKGFRVDPKVSRQADRHEQLALKFEPMTHNPFSGFQIRQILDAISHFWRSSGFSRHSYILLARLNILIFCIALTVQD